MAPITETMRPGLFRRSERDFSHGCVRIEKPMEFAEYFTFAGRHVDPFFDQVAASQGPDALRKAYNETWTTPRVVTDQFIAALEEALAGL